MQITFLFRVLKIEVWIRIDEIVVVGTWWSEYFYAILFIAFVNHKHIMYFLNKKK